MGHMEMNLTYIALDRTLTNIAWFLVVGLAVVGVLLGGFKLGQQVRAKEPPPPAPETQPHLPNGGAVYEVREERDPVEIPEGGLRPHEMQGYGNFGSTTSSRPDDVRTTRESGYEHSRPWQTEGTEPPPPAPVPPPEPSPPAPPPPPLENGKPA